MAEPDINRNEAPTPAEAPNAPTDTQKPAAKPKMKAKQPVKKAVGTGKKKIGKIVRTVVIVLLVLAALFFAINLLGIKRIPLLKNTPLADMKAFNLFNKNTGTAADNFTGATVVRRTVERTLTGTGTLQPNDSYNVTALASGEIMQDYFEEGDEVEEDALLMTIDSSNLESSLERAQNSYDSAYDSLQDLYEDRGDLTVKSDWTGMVRLMDLEVGDDVNAGMAVATILDDETMLIDVPFLQTDAFNMASGMPAVVTMSASLEETAGVVDHIDAGYTTNEFGVKVVDVTIAVKNPGGIAEGMMAGAAVGECHCTAEGTFYYNVNETVKAEASGTVKTVCKGKGDSVAAGDVILELESKQLEDSITRAERTLKEARNSLNDAKDAFDNYAIKAPISGTVIQKNFKKGEKIGGSSGSSNVIAIIYDMSLLKFDMNIDELDIDAIALGQEVKVTCDAHAGETYVGYVTQISVVGTTQNGTTYYPITVSLNDYGSDVRGNKLKPGMNIDAEIVLDRAENALVIPVSYLGRGNTVKYITAAAAAPLLEPVSNPGASGFTGTRPGGDAAGEETGNTDENAERPSFNNGETSERPSFGGEMSSFPNRGEDENTGTTGTAETTERPDFSGLGGFGGFNAIPTYISVPKSTAYDTVTVDVGISDDEYVVILSKLEEGDVVLLEDSSAVAESGWGSYGNWGGMGSMGGGMTSMHNSMGFDGGSPGGMGGGMPGGMGGGMPGGMR